MDQELSLCWTGCGDKLWVTIYCDNLLGEEIIAIS